MTTPATAQHTPLDVAVEYDTYHPRPGITVTYGSGYDGLPGRSLDEALALKRLIAAAPRMLEALREAVKSLEYAAKVLQAPESSTFRENLADARAILRELGEGER